MKYKIQYETEEHRSELIEKHSELKLVEEQNLLDGNYLVFTDDKEIALEPPRPMIIMTEQEYLALVGTKP